MRFCKYYVIREIENIKKIVACVFSSTSNLHTFMLLTDIIFLYQSEVSILTHSMAAFLLVEMIFICIIPMHKTQPCLLCPHSCFYKYVAQQKIQVTQDCLLFADKIGHYSFLQHKNLPFLFINEIFNTHRHK